MLERLMIVLIVAACASLLYWWYVERNLSQAAAAAPADPILRDVPPGSPIIVYFTTPGCIPCQTQQQPALARLAQWTASTGQLLHIVQVDAAAQPDAAERWGVMTAPTTFVLAADGRPRAINYGFADEHKLRQQLLSNNHYTRIPYATPDDADG